MPRRPLRSAALPLAALATGALAAHLATAAGDPAPAEASNVRFLDSGRLPPGLPFSEAVEVGDVVFLSGQIGLAPGKRELVPGGIRAEARQTMANIRSVLEAHGLAMKDLVKCTVMLADIAEWGTFNEEYVTFFEKPFPARSAFGASGLAMGARVEVECIAARPRRGAGATASGR